MRRKLLQRRWLISSVLVPLAGVLILAIANLFQPIVPLLWQENRSTEQGPVHTEDPTPLPSGGNKSEENRAPPGGGQNRPTQPTTNRSPISPEKYINTAISNRPQVKETAILVLHESDQPFPELEQVLAGLLADRGIEPIQSFFQPAFTSEGRALALFAGEWGIAQELELSRRVDNLLLGRASVEYTTSAQFEGLWTAGLRLELKCLDVVLQRICGTRIINAQGAGYSKSAALENVVKAARPQCESYMRKVF